MVSRLFVALELGVWGELWAEEQCVVWQPAGEEVCGWGEETWVRPHEKTFSSSF